MTTALKVVAAAPRYLGTPYSTLDCQAFVEKCLSDAGLRKDLAGSNAWYRFLMKEGWVGSPEECKRTFGRIPPGAFLFILSSNGKEPEKYKNDGIGNASHIGLYTNLSGAEMVSQAIRDGNAKARQYDFGSGAIHSSSSRGAVCTSNFSGKAINGGWNQVGLWKAISYGDDIDRILNGGGGEIKVEYQAKVVGGALNMREQPSKSSERICQIPDGTVLMITDEAIDWAKTSYTGRVGWVMKTYLEHVGDPDTITVSRKELEAIYDQIGDWLGKRG